MDDVLIYDASSKLCYKYTLIYKFEKTDYFLSYFDNIISKQLYDLYYSPANFQCQELLDFEAEIPKYFLNGLDKTKHQDYIRNSLLQRGRT